MNYQDYYKTLGVSKSATEKEIKQAYRKLAQKYHPDKNQGNKAAEETFKSINEAYEVLGNSENRAKYNRLGSAYHHHQQMGGAGGFDFSQFFNGGNGRPGGSGFSDFFESIFAQQQGFGGPQTRRPNLNVEHEVTIRLEEAYTGTERIITHGSDRFTAKIPAGVNDGTKIRLRGKGRTMQGMKGDLFLKVLIAPHETFEFTNEQLRTNVEVDHLTAVLGGKAIVPTMTGSVKLSIPAGTQPNQTMRLKGKGMPKRTPKDSFGDLLVTIKVAIPQTLTEPEKELYQKLAELKENLDPISEE
ncbi:MAG: J domain-containing protein [Chloroflexota bacterium]